MSVNPPIVAVIPTFAPPADLGKLIQVVLPDVEALVLSDDASPCTSDRVFEGVADQPGIHLLRHRHNAGIARGLNDGLGLADKTGAEWLLTLDQDSLVDEAYISALIDAARGRAASGERLGAIGAEVIEDRSGPMTYPVSIVDGYPCTEEVIQTGTLWKVSALMHVQGFDESLGMDAIDAAACLALRRFGYRIGLAHGLRLRHRIGAARGYDLAGRRIMVTGHNPERRSSMMRNRLRLFPAEFAESPRHALRTVRRVVVNQTLGLMLEGNRREKAKGTVRGLRPGTNR